MTSRSKTTRQFILSSASASHSFIHSLDLLHSPSATVITVMEMKWQFSRKKHQQCGSSRKGYIVAGGRKGCEEQLSSFNYINAD